MRIRKRFKISLVLLTLAALWLAGLSWFTRQVFEMPVPDATADAIVVLTGGSNRVETGFELLDKGRGKKLFISGVYRGVEIRELLTQWKGTADADIACCIVLGFEADDTLGNARETAAWMEKEGFTSLILVTANYHVKRAALALKGAAPDLQVIAYPVAPAGLDIGNWWRAPAYRDLVIREYSKYLAFLVLSILPGTPL